MLFNANDFDGIPAPACTRRVAGKLCREPLDEQGLCAACETECCEACGAVVAPGVLTPVTDESETLRCCPACVGPAVEVAPMSTAIAMSLAVEAACGGSNLLNGRTEEDDEDEDATTEVDPRSMRDTVHNHLSDEECAEGGLLSDGDCGGCGASGGEPCAECGGERFHRLTCSQADGSAVRAEAA